jgi:hypothetical protein
MLIATMPPQGSGVLRECSCSVLTKAVEAEGFGGGGMVAPAFGDMQIAASCPFRYRP